MRHKNHQSQQIQDVESKDAPSDGLHVGEPSSVEKGHHHRDHAEEVHDVDDLKECVEVTHKDAHLAKVPLPAATPESGSRYEANGYAVKLGRTRGLKIGIKSGIFQRYRQVKAGKSG